MLKSTIVFSPTSTTSIARQGISGTITLTQIVGDDRVKITVSLEGLQPNSLHGFHVHDKGITSIQDSLETTCAECGGHFNPDDTDHGSVFNLEPCNRHAGDLINHLYADDQGYVFVEFYDDLVSLDPVSRYCIVGRSIVIHEGFDDLGRCGTSTPFPFLTGRHTGTYSRCPYKCEFYDSEDKQEESLKTGNAGKRIACANISLDV